jgi:hypothetical protein
MNLVGVGVSCLICELFMGLPGIVTNTFGLHLRKLCCTARLRPHTKIRIWSLSRSLRPEGPRRARPMCETPWAWLDSGLRRSAAA